MAAEPVIGADIRLRVAPNVFTREFDGEVVVVDLERGDYFGLDVVGARAWSGLAVGRTPREVARELCLEFDVEIDRLLADLVALTHELVTRKLMEVT